MTPGWLEEILASCDVLLETTIGPMIWADARRYCPVMGGANSTASSDSLAADQEGGESPGSLRDSIEFHMDGHSLIVSASGGNGRDYAAYVELGHHIVAWGYSTGRSEKPEPFLRPALYTVRAA